MHKSIFSETEFGEFLKLKLLPKGALPVLSEINLFKRNNDEKSYLRGGSDRSFLELIQILGNEFGIKNKIIFVDSSSGEVERPSTKKTGLIGISDDDDKLKFDIVFKNGPDEYINWFIELAKKRFNFKKDC